MKTAFMISSIELGGGAEKVITQLTNNMDNSFIITIFKSEKEYSINKKRYNIIEINQKKSLFKYIYLPKIIIRLKLILSKEKPDRTISFMEYSNILNILLNKNAIISIRVDIFRHKHKVLRRIQYILIKLLYSKAKKIVVVTKELKNKIIERKIKKAKHIKVINNPLDLIKINKLKKEPINESIDFKKKFVIITVGRLVKQKNHIDLLKVYNNINKKHPETCLVIIGDGVLKQKLKEFTKKFDIKNVYFLGRINNPYKFMMKSDLFVLTSLYEGFPNVLIEAMACGLPLISYDCETGPKEIINGNGLLVPVKNKKKLEESIINLIENDEKRKRMSQQSIKLSKRYDLSNIITQWNGL